MGLNGKILNQNGVETVRNYKKTLLTIFLFVAFTIIMSNIAVAGLTDSLLAYYGCDEGTGNLIDSTGKYTLSQTGTVANASGKIGSSRGVFSTSNYFNTSGFYNYRNDIDYTFNFWLNTTNKAANPSHHLLNWNDGIGNNKYDNIVRVETPGGVRFYAHDSSVSGYATQGVINNEWIMVTAIYNGTGDKKLRLYINGTFQNITPTAVSDGSVGTKFYIGVQTAIAEAATTEKLDEIGVWNRTLTQEEITSLYNSGTGFAYPFYTAPTITNPTLNASVAYTNDTLLCQNGSFSGSNPKTNDYYRWLKNGTIISGQTSSTLNMATFGNGNAKDKIMCEWLADDGTQNATSWKGSANLTISGSTTCSSSSSKYLLYDDFESGIINSSIWGYVTGNATINNTISYNGVYSLRCGLNNINSLCLESLNKFFGINSSVLYYVSASGTPDVTGSNPFTLSYGRNYLANIWKNEGSATNVNWDYYDGTWRTFGIKRPTTTSEWHRIYWYATATNAININITNTTGGSVAMTGINPGAGSVVSFPSNISVGGIGGSVNTMNLHYDNIMIWNRSIYGDTCPVDEEVEGDSISPYWATNQTNATSSSPKKNEVIQLNVTLTDGTALSTYVLAHNMSGTMTNQTFKTIPSSPFTMVENLTITASRGTLAWQVWFNDTSNNKANTTVFNTIIQNTIPTITSPTINATLYTNDIATCLKGTFTDVDGDTQTDYYRWYLNGTLIGGQTTLTLNLSVAGNGNINDKINCEWIASDGIENATTWKGSSNTTITSTPPTITFVSQNPIDLNITNAQNNKFKVNYTVTDVDGDLDNNSILLYYKSNSSISNIMYFQNGTAYSGYFGSDFITNTSEYFYWELLDNAIYPGTYNTGGVSIDNKLHTKTTLSNANQYYKTEYYNISGSQQRGYFEIMANSTATALPSSLIYCNSTYTTGNPTTNTNCLIVSTRTANTVYDHCHTNASCHIGFQFAVNTTTGMIGSVKVTSTSYFLFGGAKDWDIYSINEVTRTGMTQSTNNKGVSWNTETYTIDEHVHQFDTENTNTTLYYYVCANDTINQACSSVRNDLMEMAGLPPTSPNIYNPAELGVYNNILSINYTKSESPNSYLISYYNISLLNSTNDNVISVLSTNNSNNLSYAWNTLSTNDGVYVISVSAFDVLGQYSTGYSGNFTIDNTIPTWTNNQTNATSSSPTYGERLQLNVTLSDSIGLSHYVLAHNLSGVISNQTFKTIPSNTFVVSENLTINASYGSVAWQVWFNDTAGNWANTTVFNTQIQTLGCQELNTANTVYALARNVNTGGTCFNITANNVTLDCNNYMINYSQTNVGYGIYNNGKNSSTIKNCNIVLGSNTASSFGIYFLGSSNYGQIINNTILIPASASTAIYLSSSLNNLLSANSITGTHHGIHLQTSSNYNNLTNNNVNTTSQIGIYLQDSSKGNIISNNIVQSATSNSIYLRTLSNNNTVIENTLINGNVYTVNVANSHNNTIFLNKMTSNSTTGVSVIYTSLSSSYNIFLNNTVNGINAFGVLQQNSTYNNFSFNNITSKLNIGVALDVESNYNFYSFNNITNLQTNGGVQINAKSNYNTFISNNITSVSNGVLLRGGSASNNFTQNDIKSSASSGMIYLESSDEINNIFSNNFLVFNSSVISQINFGSSNQNGTILSNQQIFNYTLHPLGNYLIIENTTVGKIIFTSPVSGNGTNLVGTLSSDIIFGNNSVFVNSDRSVGLNKSANVTLYNVPTNFTNPAILKDGVSCTDCYNFTGLNSGIVQFNVSSWSNYSIGENPNSAPPQVTIWQNPLNNNTAYNQNVTFIWNGVVDADGDTVYYQFYLNGTLKQNLTQTNYSANFTGEGNYSYIVGTFDGALSGINSTIRYMVYDITSPSVNNVSLIPQLNFTRFDYYNISANITDGLSSINGSIIEVKRFISGLGGSCVEFYFNGSCASSSPTNYSLNYTNGNLYFTNFTKTESLVSRIGFADTNVFYNNNPQNYNLNRYEYYVIKGTNNYTMTSATNLIIELDARKKSTTTKPLMVYLVDNSQTTALFNSEWANSNYVEIIGVINVSDVTHHSHTSNSTHYIIPITTNSDGTIGSKKINISSNFFIALFSYGSTEADSWNISYRNSTVCTNNNNLYRGNSSAWTINGVGSGCLDVDILVKNVGDGVNLTVYTNDSAGNVKVQNEKAYFTSLESLVQTRPTFWRVPAPGNVSGLLNLTWSKCFDINGDTITYNVTLVSINTTKNYTLVPSATNLSTVFNTALYANESYDIYGNCYDSSGNNKVFRLSDTLTNLSLSNSAIFTDVVSGGGGGGGGISHPTTAQNVTNVTSYENVTAIVVEEKENLLTKILEFPLIDEIPIPTSFNTMDKVITNEYYSLKIKHVVVLLMGILGIYGTIWVLKK